MYTKEQLERYPYFTDLLKVQDVSALLDQLTGIVSRNHILRFARWLIDHRVLYCIFWPGCWQPGSGLTGKRWNSVPWPGRFSWRPDV